MIPVSQKYKEATTFVYNPTTSSALDEKFVFRSSPVLSVSPHWTKEEAEDEEGEEKDTRTQQRRYDFGKFAQSS